MCKNVPSLSCSTCFSYGFPQGLKLEYPTVDYNSYQSSDSNLLLRSPCAHRTGLLDASRTYQAFSGLGASTLAVGFHRLNQEICLNTTPQRKLWPPFSPTLLLLSLAIRPQCTQHRAPPSICFLSCLPVSTPRIQVQRWRGLCGLVLSTVLHPGPRAEHVGRHPINV